MSSPAGQVPVPLTPRRAARPPAPGTLAGGMSDRHVTLLAIVVAGGFVALALAALLAPPPLSQGSWLPLHLLLAGAAPTAIAGVMPFFSAAVSGAPPARLAVRLAGVLGVAIGAGVVIGGRLMSVEVGSAGSLIAGLGGVIYLGALLAVAAATLLPLRAALGPRRFFMGAIYGLALVNVIAGVSLSTLFLLGWAPVLAAWGTLKPAHAWLNLFGFISLVIAGSLLHLLPTVAAARIRRTLASMVTFVALAAGPLLVALGFVLQLDLLALAGAGLLVAGAAALAWHALTVLRSRARWTTDRAWHTFTTWSLLAGIGWFVVAALIAAGQVIGAGASAASWDLRPLLVPLGVGWAGQVLVGAWSHLVPAVGPGSLEQHARQRRILGRAAVPRLLLVNGGAATLAVGEWLSVEPVTVGGALGIVAAGVVAVVLLGTALLALRGRGPESPTVGLAGSAG
jgi:nitrite reductase (NO-forming)